MTVIDGEFCLKTGAAQKPGSRFCRHARVEWDYTTDPAV